MVGRLQVALMSIVPTGAALVYLLWMYGWKKAKGRRGHHCQKTQIIKVTAECEQIVIGDEVDSSLLSFGEQLLPHVSSKTESSAAVHDFSGISVSDADVISLGPSCKDAKSPFGNKSVSASAVANEQSGDSSPDVTNAVDDQHVADKTNTCHSASLTVDKDGDIIKCKGDVLKCSSIVDSEESVENFLDDENDCNSCIENGNVYGYKAPSDSGCFTSNVSSEVCENGRRDSMESVWIFSVFTDDPSLLRSLGGYSLPFSCTLTSNKSCKIEVTMLGCLCIF